MASRSLVSDVWDVVRGWLLLPGTLRRLLRDREKVRAITHALRELRLPPEIKDPFIGPPLPPGFEFPSASDPP